MAYQGKAIWLTGASSGIGEALATAFSNEGAKLILSGRRVDALEAVAKRQKTDCLVLPFEVTDWDVHDEVVQKAWDWAGGVDMLVNNAGISQRSLAIDTGMEVYQRVIDIDLMAPISLTQKILPSMAERKSGHIVGISSVAGRIGTPLRTAYCAAKHGLIGYMDALRGEIESHYGIRVTTVLPGSVRTNIAVNSIQADGSARGSSDPNIEAGFAPEKAAEILLAGIAAGEREILIAQGMEATFAEMRHSDPGKLFDFLSNAGAQLAAQRDLALAKGESADIGFLPIPDGQGAD